MKKFGALRITLLILLFSFITVNAAVWYVHPDSTLNSIQAGIDSSSNSDTVLVAKGAYVENINFKGKAITVKSELGADSTTIDGGSPSNPDSASVVTFVSGEDTTSVLDGFTITNGAGTLDAGPPSGYYGGGIGCFASSPKIINNIISGNSSAVGGGGIECAYSSNPIISDNIIEKNTAPWGGGIEVFGSTSSPMITGNDISGNRANYGGGIASSGNASPTITGNTISEDTATYGGGIFTVYSSVINYNDIYNNIGDAVRNSSTTDYVNAEYNWWGDSTGPYHPDSNPTGLGDTVSDYVDFTPWSLTKAGVEVGEPDIEFLYISGCYPNPFIERIQIEYNLPIVSDVNIAVYNVFGARVKSLLNKRQGAGRYTITWSGRDERGSKLPSGLYFLRLEAGVNNETRKLLLVR